MFGRSWIRNCALVSMPAFMLLAHTANSAEPGPAGPVLANGGMEDGDAVPAHWRFGNGEGGTGTLNWDREHVHGGTRAIRIAKTNAQGYSQLVSGFLELAAGREYEVSGWIRLNRRSSVAAYFMVSQYRPDNETMQLPNAFGDSARLHPATGEWERIHCRFQLRKGSTRVRIHALTAFSSGDVSWDDLAVGPVGPEAKPRYEAPEPEVLPSLARAREILARRPRAAAHMESRGGRSRFVVDGRAVPPCFYVSPFHVPDRAQIGDFRDAGVRVYLVSLVLGRGVYGKRGPWQGAGQFDFAEVEERLWRILRVDPEGYVIFYLACDPYREWGEEHPDDVTQDQNGLKAIVQMHPKRWGGTPAADERFAPSLVSQRLRQDTATALRALVAHVRQSVAGKAVIGYHIAGSNDGQWFQWARLQDRDLHLADYCPAAQESFRNWLRRVYRDDVSALRRVWQRPDASFADAAVPGADRVWKDAFFANVAADQDVVDYNRFYSEGVAETVLHLAGVLREATDGKALLSTYYEDITCNSSNHIALGRLLASPDIDFLAGPAAYGVRLPGNCGAIRSVFGSVLQHGKMYLTEQDWRSWHSVPNTPAKNASWGRADTGKAHNAMVRRESGMMLAYGMGTWWYDMSGGWFRDDQIMAGVAEAKRAFTADLDTPGAPRADLAVFVSEASSHAVHAKAASQVRYQGIVRQVYSLNTSGVPYRMYLLADLPQVDANRHRLFLFLNCYRFSAAERAAVAALRRNGNLLVFLHAPDAAGAGDAAAAVSEITGIRVQKLPDGGRLGAVVTAPDHPLLAGTAGDLARVAGRNWPLFGVVDADAVALARYPDNDGVSVAYKSFADHQVVFAGCFGLTDQFIHNLARAAKAWQVAQPGDAVYANQHFLTVHAMHALDGGRKRFSLAQPSQVTDLTSGKLIAESATTIDLQLRIGESRWFKLVPR